MIRRSRSDRRLGRSRRVQGRRWWYFINPRRSRNLGGILHRRRFGRAAVGNSCSCTRLRSDPSLRYTSSRFFGRSLRHVATYGYVHLEFPEVHSLAPRKRVTTFTANPPTALKGSQNSGGNIKRDGGSNFSDRLETLKQST